MRNNTRQRGKDDLRAELTAEIETREAAPGRYGGDGAKPFRLIPTLSVALALRILAIAFMFRADPRKWFYYQASELNCLAHSLLAGQGLSSPFGGSTGPSAFLAPGYPLLVALVYRYFGERTLGSAVMLTGVQAVFGVIAVLLVMLLAKRLFGEQTAYLAGAMCAVSPTMVWLPALFWETSLSTLFLIGMLTFAVRCADHPEARNWIALGGFCAVAMLFNPALMLTFAGAGAWASYATRRASGRGPWLAVAACVILFAIWPIRNATALHAFVPLRSNLGYELWQGNRPGSQGFFSPNLYLNANKEEYRRYAAIGELPYMKEKATIAQAAIKANPRRFVRLSLKRAGAFWTALGGHGISWVVIGEITLASLLGVTELVLLLARRGAGAGLLLVPFLLFPLPYYVTHPDFRFRLLLQPIALLLAARLFQELSGFYKLSVGTLRDRAYRATAVPIRWLN